MSVASGIAKHIGKGMSVAFADYDHDGDVDAFVTNDTVPNFLFRNNGDGTFSEAALPAGVAVPESGRPISGMGVDFQDYDNDGWEDLHLTGISGETFPLFRNNAAARPGTFVDATGSSGLARVSATLSGWCTVFVDVNNDGGKDLFTANSHLNDRIERSEALGWKQPNSLFLNEGRGRFRDATVESGLGGLARGPSRLRRRRLRRRRPARHRRAGARRPGRALAQRRRTGQVLADRETGRDAQQSRRHRRARHRRRSGPDHDHRQRLCLVIARRGAFRAGR